MFSVHNCYLVVPVSDGEISDDGDDVVEEGLLPVVAAVPQKIARYVPELE